MQVVWLGMPLTKSTWELATSLPKDLVTEYQRGITYEVVTTTSHSGGQNMHILGACHQKDAAELQPPLKRAHFEEKSVSLNSGYV